MPKRLSDIIPFFLCLAFICLPCSAVATVCSNPGFDGAATISGIRNTYYPGSGTVPGGSTSVTVTGTVRGDTLKPVKAGDLILVMQMQDADINSSNSSSYGGSAPGSGYTTLNNSGMYEYAVVASVSGNTFNLSAPLQNSYRSQTATATAGQRTFQVIRVPQYSSVILGGALSAAAWDGSSGGVVVFDSAGSLDWNGSSIDVFGMGFRGGGGQCSNSNGTGDTLANTDYRTRQNSGVINLAATGTGTGATARGSVPNASKGEGVAGTPKLVFNGTTVTNTLINGYPGIAGSGSDFGRGAPGNAGGGGSDGDSANNDENTGGGGGGAFSIGGMGGYGWTGLTPPGFMTGGFGGYSVQMEPGLLVMGGGAGAGTTNNCTGGNLHGDASSGAPGGGIVIVRARTITGTGTISANGLPANNTVQNDASGGGGGGGAVLVFATNNNGSLGSLTINARGGNGGSNTGGGSPHGPGGGGSGGFIAVTTATGVAINVQAGVNGTTAASATSTAEYGSTASSGGYRIYTLQPTDIPGTGANALCSPLLTVSKSTVKAETVRGGTTGYLITVTNASGYGTATGVVLSDTLPGTPAQFTLASTDSITLTGNAVRSSSSDPAAGSTALSWGTFTIPGGGSVTIRFTVTVPVTTSLDTYQNQATVLYNNPAAGSPGATATISPGATYYTGGGVVPGSNYASGATTQEDVTVWAPATLTKAFAPASIAAGVASTLSIVLSNSNSVPLNNAAFLDSYPAGVTNTATPGGVITGAGCFGTVSAAAGGSSVALSGGVVPAGGSCTVSVNVTFTVAGNYTNTIPGGALSNSRNITNTAPAVATLNQTGTQPPTVTKSFYPALIQQGAHSTLTISVYNGGTTTNLTGIAFTDNLTNMQVAATPSATTTCGGVLTANAGATSISLAGGTLNAGLSCTITVQVTSGVVSTATGHPNTITGISSIQSGAGPNSNTAYLLVAATPGIAKAFLPTTIAPGAASLLTFTISNTGNIPLTSASFSDTMGNLKIASAGAAGGTCVGASENSMSGGTSNIVIKGLAIPATGSCTVIIPVTSTVSGLQSNIANGVSSTETPTPGPPSSAATVNVLFPPRMAKSFFPGGIQSGATSTMTFTITNVNSIALSGVTFSDTLSNMQVHATAAAGGSCSGAGGNTFTAGQSGLLAFTGISVPINSSCTVTLVVTSTVQSPSGGHPNSVSGATSSQTGTVVPGPPDTAYLTVLLPPTITKAFSPPSIAVSPAATTIIFTLTNPNTVQLTGGIFTDTLQANLVTTTGTQYYINGTYPGPTTVINRGSCLGVIPAGGAGAPSPLTFNGITIPANGSCTIMVDVRSTVTGNYSNVTSGVSTAQTPTAGPISNTATLSVGRVGISKVFSSPTIAAGATSRITFTVDNDSGAARTISFTDSFPAGMTLAPSFLVSNTCGGSVMNTTNSTLAVSGNTGFGLFAASVASNSTCTLVISVTAATAGTYNNTTSGVDYGAGVGPVSNTATLTVVNKPGIVTSFSPAAIDVYATSNLTFTLSNSNNITLSSANFTDTFTGFRVASPATIGGTCAGVTSAPPLVSGAASVNLTVPNLLPGSCTITIPVTSSANGTYTNTASGVTTTQTGVVAGPASNMATLTVNLLPLQASKVPNVMSASPGTLVSYNIGYSNPNVTTPLQNVVITDPVPLYTSYDSASCGSLPPGVTSCNISFTPPPTGLGNGAITWTLGGTLTAGSSGTVKLVVRIQ
jgi:hypothetical protein